MQYTNEELKRLQSLPLKDKIAISKTRIIEFVEHFKGQCHVSFSGGKDSTVLLDLVHSLYPDIPAVFINTGLEYPEIQSFAKSKNAILVRPKMNFVEVITKYGYPIISKEVSEAIYYARRIVPRERERERELSGSQIQGNNISKVNNFRKTPIRKQKELLGKRIDGEYG